MAYLYYQKQELDKAQKELDLIKTIEPRHVLSNTLTAMIIAQKGDLLSAKNMLEDIIKADNKDDFAYSALCGIYREFSQLDAAKAMILSSIELKPNSLEYLRILADICVELKDYEGASLNAEKMLAINEKYLPAHLILAKISLELKNFEKLYEDAQDIIELDSNCSLGYYFNAIALFDQDDTVFCNRKFKKNQSLLI